MSRPPDPPRRAGLLRRVWVACAWLLAGVVFTVALAAGWLEWRLSSGGLATSAPAPGAAASSPNSPPPASADTIARGAYLAQAGHCAGCHTAPGGAAYAGGQGIATPFGTVVAGNLTPDVATGLGAWSADDFWRALHQGRGRGGRWLVPAFPYTAYTLVSREDSDALWAYLRSLPPVAQANAPHALRFPYNTQLAMALWQSLYFKPQTFSPAAGRSAEWNRGAYLVQGLGHCAACHGQRNALGAVSADSAFSGGLLPQLGWYAPSLLDGREAGVADWPADEVAQLLRNGTAPRGSALGPMAEVVLGSTQHLNAADLQAMAAYLKALPGALASPAPSAPSPPSPPPSTAATPAEATVRAQGQQLYGQHCAACHGAQGEGAPGAYPALAGNRAVTMGSVQNPIRVLLQGGFTPATAGHPRPYGMPPALLDDAEIAAVLTHVRQSWGHQASAVTALQVRRVRDGGGP